MSAETFFYRLVNIKTDNNKREPFKQLIKYLSIDYGLRDDSSRQETRNAAWPKIAIRLSELQAEESEGASISSFLSLFKLTWLIFDDLVWWVEAMLRQVPDLRRHMQLWFQHTRFPATSRARDQKHAKAIYDSVTTVFYGQLHMGGRWNNSIHAQCPWPRSFQSFPVQNSTIS